MVFCFCIFFCFPCVCDASVRTPRRRMWIIPWAPNTHICLFTIIHTSLHLAFVEYLPYGTCWWRCSDEQEKLFLWGRGGAQSLIRESHVQTHSDDTVVNFKIEAVPRTSGNWRMRLRFYGEKKGIKESCGDEPLFDKGQGRLVKVGDEYSRTEFSKRPIKLSATM